MRAVLITGQQNQIDRFGPRRPDTPPHVIALGHRPTAQRWIKLGIHRWAVRILQVALGGPSILVPYFRSDRQCHAATSPNIATSKSGKRSTSKRVTGGAPSPTRRGKAGLGH